MDAQTLGRSATPAVDLIGELERHVRWSRELKQADQEDEIWDGWCDVGCALYGRVEALPNTPDNLRVRALAIACIAEEADHPDRIDPVALSPYVHGVAGRLIKQVLTCIVDRED